MVILMNDCIEREKAINEFAIRSSFYDAEWGNKRFTPDDVKEILQSIPAADVRPVVRGHWIGTKEAEEMGDIMKEFTCSVCGCCEWDCTESESFNFCPNCGADMRDANDGI